MAHNPILKQQTIGSMDRFVVELNTIGLLYKGQRPIRSLKPGEGPTSRERLTPGGMLIYVVDAAPHMLSWRVSLPAKGDKEFFSTTVNLKYRVSDPERMVIDRVTDTEMAITHALEPLLRRESRQYALNQHVQLDTALEDAIRLADLHGPCGLQLVGTPSVVIDLSAEDHRRIKALNDLERAMRVPQSAEHVDDLPSHEPAYNFHITVNYSYKVSKPDEMPTDSLLECEKQLWPRIRRALQKESRKYAVTQIVEATDALQEALDDLEGYENFGLKVLTADVTVDLEEEARKRYVALAIAEHNNKLKQAELAGLKQSKEFYSGLIREGQWAVLAVAVSNGEIKMADLADKMSEHEQQKLEKQFDLLKMMRDASTRDTEQEHGVVKVLVNSVTRQVVDSPPTALLPPSSADSGQTDEKAKDSTP
jgi:hypothetical protein